jgi:hypothetical protein
MRPEALSALVLQQLLLLLQMLDHYSGSASRDYRRDLARMKNTVDVSK